MKSTYQVLIEGEDRPRGNGYVFGGATFAKEAAASLAAQRGCIVRVVENRLGGAHHTRAVEVARYRPPREGEEGGQLVQPAADPHIRRPLAGICAALALLGSLSACDLPAGVAGSVIAHTIGEAGAAAVVLTAGQKRKGQEPGALPVPPAFVTPPPAETKQPLPEVVPGPRFKQPIRFWLT